MSFPTAPAAVIPHAVDASHSTVQFRVRHLGFSKVTGRFQTFQGSVALDPADLTTLEAGAAIDVASINTGDDKRDAHLRSADFFDADVHPQMLFRSTGVREVQGASFLLDGDLSLHGVTRPVTLRATYLGEATDPWGGRRVALEATTTINRKDFGLTWNAVLETGGLLVGEDVEITLEVEAVRAEG